MTFHPEKEVWEYLAKKWDGRLVSRGKYYPKTEREIRIGKVPVSGICSALMQLVYQNKIPYTLKDQMQAKLMRHRPQTQYAVRTAYFYPCTAAGAKRRAAKCRAMARIS